MKLSSTERFSSRVEAYLKYRPSYPQEIISYLELNAGLSKSSIVADIGSGTGFFSKLFLENGNNVFGIEPNKPMREAAENLLSDYKNFFSVDGTAENTSLPNNSVDFIVAAQAFHWFNPVKTKIEFRRIARDNAKVVLVWNERDIEGDDFQNKYEEILKQLPDYLEVEHRNVTPDRIEDFVSPSKLHTAKFYHSQVFDFDSLLGRLLSSSYCPDEKSEIFHKIKNELFNIFSNHQTDGEIDFKYRTMLYWADIWRWFTLLRFCFYRPHLIIYN